MPRAATTTDVFNAIAEPRRRELVDALGDGEPRSVGELVERLALAQSAVSKHLGVLRKVGIVSVVKQGQHRMYRLNGEKLKAVYDWTKTFEKFWAHQMSRIKERAERLAKERSSTKKSSRKTERVRKMVALQEEQTIHILNIIKEVEIAAPIEIAFEAMLAEMGPESQMPDGTAYPLKLELWPGGRWYRDLGDNTGHLWGHVQVIKPPKLIEICGPMFMSYAAASHLQYRLTADGNITRLKLTHTAFGMIPDDHRTGVNEGWEYKIQRIRELAQAKR